MFFIPGWHKIQRFPKQKAYPKYNINSHKKCPQNHSHRHISCFDVLLGPIAVLIQEFPEAAVILMIRDIYHEENLLRDLPARERQIRRWQNVRPRILAFFRFADEFDVNVPDVSNKMKDAIMYTRNQKNICAGFWRMGISLLTTGMPSAG